VAGRSPLRLYSELASWWPLLSPPEEYEEEAAFFLDLLGAAGAPAGPRCTLLELGAGGGGLGEAGLPARCVTDPWDREIFLATRASRG
jgi:hypothetical protein